MAEPQPADYRQHLEIETPEHVMLDYEIAGVGSRMLAALIDFLIIAVLLLASLLVISAVMKLAAWVAVIGLLVIFTLVWGYFTLFEGFRDGQTPGMKRIGIRVVRDTGHGVTFADAAARNLVLPIDLFAAIGVFLMAVHPRGKRLGDLVAGTVVIRDHPMVSPAPSPREPIEAADHLGSPQLDDAEFHLLREFVARSPSLPAAVRERFTRQIAQRLSDRIAVVESDETAFIERVYADELARRRGRFGARSGAIGHGGGARSVAEQLVARKSARWAAFETLARRIDRDGLDALAAQELPDFAARYREIAADLARARTYHADDAVVARLDRLAAAGHSALYRSERHTWRRIGRFLVQESPGAVLESWRYVVVAILIFAIPAGVGYATLRQKPALADELLPDVVLERGEAGPTREAAGEGYVEAPAASRPLVATSIILNNVGVAYRCFGWGIVFGIGALIAVAFNGLFFGAIAGYFQNVGLLGYLLTFVVGHGPLEIFSVSVAGAAGFLLGRALIAPGEMSRKDALVLAGRRAIRMISAVTVLLIVAGCIEGFVSASSWPLAVRLTATAASLVFLLLYLLSGARFRRGTAGRVASPDRPAAASRVRHDTSRCPAGPTAEYTRSGPGPAPAATPRRFRIGVAFPPGSHQEIRIDLEAIGAREMHGGGLPRFGGMDEAVAVVGQRHLDRHVETGNDVGPVIGQRVTVDPVLELGNHGGAEIFVEDLAEITTGMAGDVRLDLASHHRLVVEGALQSPEDTAPLLIVVHDLPDGVQHQPALAVHVARPLGVHAVRGNDRRVVACPIQQRVRRRRVVAVVLAPGIEPFGVVREALVHPHVRLVLGGDAVAEPLVGAFVDDDEIELEAQRGAPAAVAITEAIAVGHRRLVLHAGVGDFDQLVAIPVPRVGTEPVLETLQHGFRLRPLAVCGVKVIGQRPEVEGELALFAGQRVAVMRVRPGGDGDGVVVDGAAVEPFERGGVVGIVGHAPQSAVGHVAHRVGNGERNPLAVGFVGLGVLVGPPDARSDPLVSRHDPGVAQRVVQPAEAAFPRRAPRDTGTAVVVHGDRVERPGALGFHQRREERVAVTPIGDVASVLHHAVDLERRHQVDLHHPGRPEHAVRNAVVPVDGAVRRVNGDVEIVERHVPPDPAGCGERSPERVRVGEDRCRRWCTLGGERGGDNDRGCEHHTETAHRGVVPVQDGHETLLSGGPGQRSAR